jgi:hypothetical protein
MKSSQRLLYTSIFLLVAAGGSRLQAMTDDTEKSHLRGGFENPPDSAKPRTWWHWVSGNVSSEGIMADLKAMKQIGLGGAQIFTVQQSPVKGPIEFLSPEWRKLMHQSIVEADQLDLEIAMEGCDGWSESGGHWVTPAQAMQKVVWTENQVEGGQKISLALPQPPTIANYYEDIALFAFPTPAGDVIPAPDQITASDPDFVAGNNTVPTAAAPLKVKSSDPGKPLWIQYAYNQPTTCSSLELVTSGFSIKRVPGELQVSDDGTTFRHLSAADGNSFSFPSTTGKFFRIYYVKTPATPAVFAFSRIVLGGIRVSDLSARTGMAVALDLPFEDKALTAEQVIDPKALVNLTGKTEWAAPAGKWTLLRLGHTATGATTHPSTKPGLEVDKMDAAAVSFHIKSLYTPVWDDSPNLVGTTFKTLLLDSWEAGCENWSPDIREQFKKRRGYDLGPWLPALTGRVILNLDATERFLWDYRRTLADLVAENHYAVFQQAAHARHMLLASEAPGVGTPTVADGLQCKGRTDIPMGEFWVNNTADQNIDDPKEAASAAHIYGMKIAATESYTSRPKTAMWSNDPYSLKMLGDQEFCLGINRFVFHRYAAQPWLDRFPGMSMGPWGINFERTNTWWDEGSAWISYISRSQYLLQQGRYIADLCYYYGEGAPIFFQHAKLAPAVPAGFAYDACDAEILLNQMSVDDGCIVLKSGMRYRVLVLPDTNRMTLPVLQKVEQLVKQGALVYGPKPAKSPSLAGYPEEDGQIQTIANEVWGDCDGKSVTEHAYGKGRVIWGRPLETALAVKPDFQSAQPDLLYIHRVAETSDIYFVSNQESTERAVTCTFRVANKVPEFWHSDTGKIETVALFQQADGCTTVPIHFDPSGSVFVIFQAATQDTTSLAALTFQGKELFPADGAPAAEIPVTNAIGQPELLAWKAGTYAATTHTGSTLHADLPDLPNPLAVGGPWQVAFQPKRGAPEKATFDQLISFPDSTDDGIKYFSGTATYEKDLTLPAEFFAASRHAYLDLGDVKNLAEVSVNGKALGILWKAPFRVDLSAAAKPGLNHLEIKVTDLWPNRLIGDAKLPKDKQITWASQSIYTADSPLLPSGLLGPVQVIAAQDVTLQP